MKENTSMYVWINSLRKMVLNPCRSFNVAQFEASKTWQNMLMCCLIRFGTAALWNPLWGYSTGSRCITAGGRWWNSVEKRAPNLEQSFSMEMVESQLTLPVFSGRNSCARFSMVENSNLGRQNLSLSLVLLSIWSMWTFPPVYIDSGTQIITVRLIRGGW